MLQILQRIIAVILSSFTVFTTFVSGLSYEEFDVFQNVVYGNAERIKSAFENAGAVHKYILYPLSNHGLGLDPLCEMEYIKETAIL